MDYSFASEKARVAPIEKAVSEGETRRSGPLLYYLTGEGR